MIGGLAWPSTIEYYKMICTKVSDFHQKRGDTPPYAVPEMVIESANIAETRALRGKTSDETSWAKFDEKFRSTLLKLKAAGADFGFIASNTPHMRIQSITKDLDFKVISILDAMAQTARNEQAQKVLVLGTAVTMRAPVYQKILNQFHIETVPQLPSEIIDEIQHLIDTDFYTGNPIDARARLLAICHEYAEKETTAISLACTELPLAFPDQAESETFEFDGFQFINTTVAHVNAVVEEVLGWTKRDFQKFGLAKRNIHEDLDSTLIMRVRKVKSI